MKLLTKEKGNIFFTLDGKKIRITKDFCHIVGNIYNLDRLGEFKSNTSNEEKVLELYKKNGEEIFKKLNGEFGLFLVIDGKIILVRDCYGTKQLYYAIINEKFICSDSLEVFLESYKQDLTFDRKSLVQFLCYSYIQAPKTIFNEVSKLNASSYLVYDEDININCYYDVIAEYKNNKNTIMDKADGKSQLEESLVNAIKMRCEGKEEIGIFFSSGIDSSLLASIATNNTKLKVNTFTLGFEEVERNEAKQAKQIAEYLNTNHHEYYINREEAKNLIKKMPKIYFEPFADPSILPTVYLNQQIDSKLPLFLTGDGADQFYCGSKIYDEFTIQEKIRRIVGRCIEKVVYKNKSAIIFKNYYMPKNKAVRSFVNKKPKINYNLSTIKEKGQKKYMLYDLKTYLPNRLFTKVNYAASFSNLNLSHPFVDNDFVDITLKLDHRFKYYKGQKKHILRIILRDYLPKELIHQSKAGFGIPLGKWIYGIYKDDILKISQPDAIKKQGLFPPDKISNVMDRLKKAKLTTNELQVMFAYYIFQIWYQEYFGGLLEEEKK